MLPRKTAIWGCSSVGRAPRSQRGGHGFESHHLHHLSSTKILPTTETTRYGFHILWFLLYLVVFTQKASASESLILTAVFLRFFKKTGFEPKSVAHSRIKKSVTLAVILDRAFAQSISGSVYLSRFNNLRDT